MFCRYFQRQENPAKPHKKARGLSLIELAITAIILSLLSVSVAVLLNNGINTQLTTRTHEYQQLIALNIIERLRLDLLTAENITVSNGNQRLAFVSFTNNPAGENVVWDFTGGTAFRNDTAFHLSPTNAITFTIQCGDAAQDCFVLNPNVLSPGNVNSITLNEFRVVQNIPAGGGTIFDNEFGPGQYRINEYTFDVLAGSQFQ